MALVPPMVEPPEIARFRSPESKLHLTVPSSTPQGRTRTIHVFHPGSNNENEFTSLSPFHTIIVLKNTLLQYQVQSAEFKQRNWNKLLMIRYKDPSISTRRILYTIIIPQATPATGVNKLWVHNVLTRLTRVVGITSRLQRIW